uniref:Uncharacterized protein n=1 Tax=Tanacetum cinerariifolium TaxID=118510 RepID=A0A699HKS6_TANCI|nr:hypothetical protein [Tanacetum cinerariifolium]
MADFLGLIGGRGGRVANGGVARIPAGCFTMEGDSAFGVTDGDSSHDSFVFKAYTRLFLGPTPSSIANLTKLNDVVVYGIEMWPTAEYERTMYTIRQRFRPMLMRMEKRYGPYNSSSVDVERVLNVVKSFGMNSNENGANKAV